MKLRVRHNSLRLRLGKSEIESLSQGQQCREAIHFPGSGRLDYTLTASNDPEIRAWFAASAIRITVPSAQLTAWCASNQTGLSADIAAPGEPPLTVLIEKDFRCLDTAVTEDQSDTFDNPLEAHPNCDVA